MTGSRIAVDTGFIVYNELNYPDLTALFDHLGVETQPSRDELLRCRPMADSSNGWAAASGWPKF